MQSSGINNTSECCLIIYGGNGVKKRRLEAEMAESKKQRKKLKRKRCRCHFLYHTQDCNISDIWEHEGVQKKGKAKKFQKQLQAVWKHPGLVKHNESTYYAQSNPALSFFVMSRCDLIFCLPWPPSSTSDSYFSENDSRQSPECRCCVRALSPAPHVGVESTCASIVESKGARVFPLEEKKRHLTPLLEMQRDVAAMHHRLVGAAGVCESWWSWVLTVFDSTRLNTFTILMFIVDGLYSRDISLLSETIVRPCQK